MKKLLLVLLTFVMLLSLCACGDDDAKTTDPGDSNQSTTNGTEDPTGATQSPTEALTTPPSTCDHSWQEETCTAPKTCTKCGTTEGGANGHSWSDATCTAPKTCTKCGTTEGSANGHSWSDATCTVPKTCSKCGVTDGSAAGHNWKDATCSAPKTCSKCSATEGDIGNHKYSSGTCEFCNKIEIINPKVGLKEKGNYYCTGVYSNGDNLYIFQFYDSKLHYTSDRWAVYWTNEEWVDHDGDIIMYKDKTYYPVGYGGSLPNYTLTDEEIILWYADSSMGDGEYRLVVNSEYDLIVTYSTGNMFKVGEILDLVE